MDSDSGTKAIAVKNVRGNTLANPATSRSGVWPKYDEGRDESPRTREDTDEQKLQRLKCRLSLYDIGRDCIYFVFDVA